MCQILAQTPAAVVTSIDYQKTSKGGLRQEAFDSIRMNILDQIGHYLEIPQQHVISNVHHIYIL